MLRVAVCRRTTSPPSPAAFSSGGPVHAIRFFSRKYNLPTPTAPLNDGTSTGVQRRSELQGPLTAICRRNFSTTGRRYTRAIVNPRKDPDGKEMLVHITPNAAERLEAIALGDQKPSTCLRITVESGGCHGFQYLMSLTSMDQISEEEDTVFESEDGKSAKVVIDEPSLNLLKGSKIDYTKELIGSQFKVVGIPGAKSSCGCGTSFDIG